MESIFGDGEFIYTTTSYSSNGSGDEALNIFSVDNLGNLVFKDSISPNDSVWPHSVHGGNGLIHPWSSTWAPFLGLPALPTTTTTAQPTTTTLPPTYYLEGQQCDGNTYIPFSSSEDLEARVNKAASFFRIKNVGMGTFDCVSGNTVSSQSYDTSPNHQYDNHLELSCSACNNATTTTTTVPPTTTTTVPPTTTTTAPPSPYDQICVSGLADGNYGWNANMINGTYVSYDALFNGKKIYSGPLEHPTGQQSTHKIYWDGSWWRLRDQWEIGCSVFRLQDDITYPVSTNWQTDPNCLLAMGAWGSHNTIQTATWACSAPRLSDSLTTDETNTTFGY